MQEENTNILVLALGSEILRDLSLPLKLHDLLKEELAEKGYVFRKSSLTGLDIVQEFEGFHRVVIIDTLKSIAENPGQVYVNIEGGYINTSCINSIHDASMKEILILARVYYNDSDLDIVQISIEVSNDSEFGTKLSDKLKDHFDNISMKVKEILENYRALLMNDTLT